MTRFRKSILSLAISLALLVPFGATASADPIDPGTSFSSSAETDRGPAKGGHGPWTGAAADPIDPGTGR